MYKDAVCFIEPILTTAPYIKADLWSSGAHYTSHAGAIRRFAGHSFRNKHELISDVMLGNMKTLRH